MITIDAPAKINLSLAIIGKKGNKQLMLLKKKDAGMPKCIIFMALFNA